MTVRCKSPKCIKVHEFNTAAEDRVKKQGPEAHRRIVITCDSCGQTYMYSVQTQPR